jgi:hypothetical protein
VALIREASRTLRLLLALALLVGLVPARVAAQTGGSMPSDFDHTLYLLPILDGQPTPERVERLVERLGRGGTYLQVGFSGVFRYMADVDPERDYEIVPTRLAEIATAARAAGVPFLVHLNGGRWAGGGPLVERLAQDRNAMAWNQDDHPWTHLVDGEYHLSLSAYNQQYRSYKERNLRAAAAWLKSFVDGPDGHLLVGVSTDSEVILNLHGYYDYSPGAIAEFVDWLASRNQYGAGGRWQGEGQGLTVQALNERYGTQFSRLERVDPPRSNDGSRFWQDWTSFRVLLVDHSVQEQVDWIREAGLPPERIFSHQSPALQPEIFGDTLATADVVGGSLGITLYGPHAADGELMAAVRSLNRNWGVFEYNPQGLEWTAASVEGNLAALDLLRSYSPRVVCPYHWDDLGGPNEVGYTIMDTPLETALQLFLGLYGHQPLPG